MTLDNLTNIMLSNQKINVRNADYEDLYSGIVDKLDDEKHKDILNAEVNYIEVTTYGESGKIIVIITLKGEGK